jgi:hypothetical protein
VQITGEYKSVQNALFQVTGSLRDKFLPSEVFKEARAKSRCVRVNEDPMRNNTVPHNKGAVSSPPLLQLPQVNPPSLSLPLLIVLQLSLLSPDSSKIRSPL